jgi:hypothetical protein
MNDELGMELETALDVRMSVAPPIANVLEVIRKGTRRRLRNRAAVAAGILALGAGGIAAPQLDIWPRSTDPDPIEAVGGVEQVGRMTVPRAAHAATLLDSGKVLVSGGFSGDTEIYYDSAEIYDPATRAFLPTTSMTTPRTGHASVLLNTGSVLIAGGWGNGFLASAELYDPATGLFSATGGMKVSRDAFTATRLKDGRVLVVGGFRDSYESFNRSAEIYDPATGDFAPTGSLRHARAAHTATLLRDGRVVITGGRGPGGVLRSVEVYDPASGTFRSGGRLLIGRQKHGAALLDSGKVLVVGGSDINDFQGRIRSAEVYNPSTGRSRAVGHMSTVRFKIPSPINLVETRRVLVPGGADVPDLYREPTRTFSPVEGRFDGAQSFPTATLLQDGTVLVTGGYDEQVTATDGAWLYVPN